LKKGYAYLELGDKPQARTVLNSLLKRFPQTQEARLARERLSRVR
ncbi:MAG: tetratricopeptide repeat protein, partial [Candidatus Methylomirabilaceae bacterium]